MYSLHAVIEVKDSSLLFLILAKKNRGTPETLYSVVSVYYCSIFNETSYFNNRKLFMFMLTHIP